MDSLTEEYDFIIVGGGNSGCVLASRLAHTPSAPKVLLLEGGGRNENPALLTPDQKWSLAFTDPLLNYGYLSIAQNQLCGQQIPCVRGRGLGGSTAINFAVWLVGHRDDYNHWADEVDDLYWRWDGEKGVKNRLRKLENLLLDLDLEQANLLDQKAQQVHSAGGTINMGYRQSWSDLDKQWFKAGKELGVSDEFQLLKTLEQLSYVDKVNGDINSGDPTGFGLPPINYHNGLRVTAATAYLSSPPPNLTVATDTVVSKVILNSETVVGVETISGKTYKASKEVILSSGSFDTPKILLLSGIGPSAELSSLSIPVIKDIPGVGKNLKDHSLALMTILVKPQPPINIPTTSQSESNPLRETNTQCPMAWVSSPEVKSSAEFTALDAKTKGHLTKVPSFELMTLELPMEPGLPPLGPDDRVITFGAGVMNPQSSGTVTLSSSDPTQPCIIDPKYLSHPYDRRVAIEALRSALKLAKVPTFVAVTEKIISGPEDDSDDKLFEHCKKSLSPIWHYAGTCKMGREDDETAVVDKDFRVRGVKGLRVVDLSVAAVLPNNHTQSTAYLIGETAAEKMIEEYGL